MKRISVRIEGVTPLLVNAFTDAAAMKATNGSSSALVGSKGTPREQAEGKLYVGVNGNLMIPSPNMFRCVIDAGKYFKAGKTKVTTQKSSLLCAAASIEEVELPIDDLGEPWTVDQRAVRNPATGGRFLCFRPKFDRWALSFVLAVDESVMSVGLVREIVDRAGSRIGLGDFRPDRKGPFGKFKVTLWEVEKE